MKTNVWTEWIPFVDLFLNFYLCSGSPPELISDTPSPPLLQPFFFHRCNKAAVTLSTFPLPHFFSPFILNTPLPFSCVSFPLSLFHWISRQLADFITCYLDCKTYDCAASSHSVNQLVLPNTRPSPLVHMHSTHMPSWGISSAMIAGLFQTVSNVLYSVGGLHQARDRRYIRQAWWMDVVM